MGFPISQRYGALHGYYKFTSVGGDLFHATVYAQSSSNIIGTGGYLDATTRTVYREFVANLLYLLPDAVDNGIVMFNIVGAGGFPNIGSTFVVDDLSMGAATGVNDLPNGLPKAFRLEQNFPNPFNPTTNIIYDVPVQSHVRMSVFDVLGREVAELVNEVQTPGRYKAVFDGAGLPSGAYFYRMAAGNFVETRRFLLVK
jgi:hypothetical protein